MPNHDHHCECKHTDVAFCVKCDLVYCKGCKREWQNPLVLSVDPRPRWDAKTGDITWPPNTTWGSDTICDHANDSVSGELVLDAVSGPHTHSGG